MYAAGSRERDLWSLAAGERAATEESEREVGAVEGESSVLLVGSCNAGKTSMILKLLEREEAPKPTTALDYTFGRKSRGPNMAKVVTHLWELGGGTSLSDLVNIPIIAHSISLLSVAIVLDLSRPDQLWQCLQVFLDKLRSRVATVLAELKASQPELVQRLKRKAWAKFGHDHPDQDLIDPLPVPLVILGNKYDQFQNLEPERKKMVCRTLRFVAHTNGASLYFVSMKSDVLVARVRQLLSHLAFGSPLSRTMSMDYTKPLVVPAGSDALGQIGAPSLPSGDLARISAKNPLDLWKQAYCGFFPQVEEEKQEKGSDPTMDADYLEPDIDSIRAIKNQELEKYRRDCERKHRHLGKQK